MSILPLAKGLLTNQVAIFNVLEPEDVVRYNNLLMRVGMDVESIISQREQKLPGVNGRNPNPMIEGDMGVDPIPPKILVTVTYRLRKDYVTDVRNAINARESNE